MSGDDFHFFKRQYSCFDILFNHQHKVIKLSNLASNYKYASAYFK